MVKTTGDGFHAAFATAHDAIDAAVDTQLGLGSERWDATGPLRVRMGLHTCEAEVRDGDYYGSEVNRAARLMSVSAFPNELERHEAALLSLRGRLGDHDLQASLDRGAAMDDDETMTYALAELTRVRATLGDAQ